MAHRDPRGGAGGDDGRGSLLRAWPGRRRWRRGRALPLAGAAGTKSLADPAGDAGAGFDITSFAVSKDDAGTISFRVVLPAVTALPDNMGVLIFLDTDLKAAENNPIDCVIVAVRNSAALLPYTPSGLGTPFVPRSLTTRFEPGVVHTAVARADIGNPRALIASAMSVTLASDGTPDLTANQGGPRDVQVHDRGQEGDRGPLPDAGRTGDLRGRGPGRRRGQGAARHGDLRAGRAVLKRSFARDRRG